MAIKVPKKIIIPVFLVMGVVSFVLFKEDDSQAQEEKNKVREIVAVRAQTVEDSKTLNGSLKYPGVVASSQEIKITAPIGGVATFVNFDLGEQVGIGRQLVRIDDQGTGLAVGGNGFKSSQVQQLELSAQQAKKSWSLAKKNYNNDKTSANKTAKQIAELQYQNAQVALDAAINNRQVVAPISGTVTGRQVSQGDSVVPGQALATISKTNLIKIQFYVDKEELDNFTLKSTVTVSDNQNDVKARVVNIAPQADTVSKRFLIEAVPTEGQKLLVGTVINVRADITRQASSDNGSILPLSAITVGQNENYVFVADNGTAKKAIVEILDVNGETAHVKTDLSQEAQIIVEGNKLLKEGDRIEIK